MLQRLQHRRRWVASCIVLFGGLLIHHFTAWAVETESTAPDVETNRRADQGQDDPIAQVGPVRGNRDSFRQPERRFGRVGRPSLPQRDHSDVKSAFRAVVSQPRQGTVAVLAEGKRIALGGIVDPDGYVLTKASQLQGQVHCELWDGRRLLADVIGVHRETDLAMLKVNSRDLPVITWSDRAAPPIGSLVATPGRSETPIAIGVVSVDPRAVPAPSGVLGVHLDQGENGPRVTRVMPNSGAAKAGLQVDDVLLGVNGTFVETPDQLVRLIRRQKAGEQIRLSVARGEKTLELTATLGNPEVVGPLEHHSNFQNSLGGSLSDRRAGFPLAIQHDSFLQPYDCGGPLVDLDGKTVAINIARAGRVSTLALPVAVVKPLIAELKSGRLAPQLAAEKERVVPNQSVQNEDTSFER